MIRAKTLRLSSLLLISEFFLLNPAFSAVSDIHLGLKKITKDLIDGYKAQNKNAERKTLAIFPLYADEKLTKANVGLAASEWLGHEFVSDGTFIVVERVALDKILREQHLQLTGAVDPESAVEVGKLLGAGYLILGSVSKVASRYELNMRLVATESGEILSTAYEDFSSEVFEGTVLESVRRSDPEMEKRESEFRRRKLRWFVTLDNWASKSELSDEMGTTSRLSFLTSACNSTITCDQGFSVYQQKDFHTKRMRGVGARVGLLYLIQDGKIGFLSTGDIEIGGSFGFVRGPFGHFSGRVVNYNGNVSQGELSQSSKSRFYRLLVETYKPIFLSKLLTLRLGGGMGPAIGHIVTSSKISGDIANLGVSSELASIYYVGFTGEVSSIFELNILGLNLDFGARLATFPSKKETSNSAGIAWTPWGLFVGTTF